MNLRQRRKTLALAAIAAVSALAGCQSRQAEAHTPVGDLTGALEAEYKAKEGELPLAGTKKNPPIRAYSIPEMISSSGLVFHARTNPFALFAEEASFQSSVRYNLILSKLEPQYSTLLPAPVDPPPPELNEPEAQPYRRASGIYFGDTVSAIIEMGDGKTYIVSPGQRVGDTEWYVESVDAEKVILYRTSRRDPKRVVIRLETPPLGGG